MFNRKNYGLLSVCLVRSSVVMVLSKLLVMCLRFLLIILLMVGKLIIVVEVIV